MAELRKFPYPFRAMLAISTDIDHTTPAIFRELHRFMNTREQTPMGEGVGLDVADSFWFYDPVEWLEMRYFKSETWREPAPEADELVSYLRCGWIDTMHTYGNFSGALHGWGGFERRHAVKALEILDELGIRLRVWTNHGGAGNVQNFGRAEYMEGDRPGSPAYHTDLLLDYGIQFAWNHEAKAQFGHDSLITPLELEDGRRLWGFPRQFQELDVDGEALEAAADCLSTTGRLRDGRSWMFSWYPDLLPWQLAPAKLDGLVERSQYAIVAQHLGTLGRPVGSRTHYSDPTVDAFRTLADYQERGLVVVARASLLLEYNRVHEHLVFDSSEADGVTTIRIEKVADAVFGDFRPTLDQLRGIAFTVDDCERAALLVADEAVPEHLILRTRSSEEGDLVGIVWHGSDTTDHSAPFARTFTRATARLTPEPAQVGGDASAGAERRPRRVFVVGAGRSGTTLLANLLGLHSRVEPIYETGFVVSLLTTLALTEFLSDEQRNQQLRDYQDLVARWGRDLPDREVSGTAMPALPFGKVHLGFSAEELNGETERLVHALRAAATQAERLALARAYVGALFDGQAGRAGKATWVNKTPLYAEYLEDLDQLFPDALFVHIVRDGRDVVESVLTQDWGIHTPRRAALRWLRQVEAGLLFEQEHADRVVRVRFEDLVEQPVETLPEIFDAAGLRDESAEVVAEFERRVPLLRDRRFAWRGTDDPAVTRRAERVAVLELMEPTLSLLGYPLTSTGDVKPTVVTFQRLANLRLADALEEEIELRPELSSLRERALAYDAVAKKIASLRNKAWRFEQLEQELPGLEEAAAAYDEVVARLPELRAKANKRARIEQEIADLQPQAAAHDEALARLPELRAKAKKVAAIEKEISELEQMTATYKEAAGRLQRLRARVRGKA